MPWTIVREQQSEDFKSIYTCYICIDIISNGFVDYRVETAPMLVPFLPVKDIADENKEKLTKDVHSTTPPDLKIAVKGK